MTTITQKRPLRDYQARCIDLTYAALEYNWEHPNASPFDPEYTPFSGYYTLPTGTGKTRIATGLIEKLSQHGRVLVLAHRKELIEQMAQSIREDIPGADVGICMAERNQISASILVGSIQTLDTERLSLLWRSTSDFRETTLFPWEERKPIVAILIDEGHHITETNSYASIIKETRAVYPQCAVIACTATPYRSDKATMQSVVPTCTFSRSIPEMQEAGWLSPVTWNPLVMDFDISKLRTSSLSGEKDYKAEDIEVQLFPQSMHIVEKTLPLLENRPTLVFAATVRHAQELCRAYRDAGAWADVVWGDMPKSQREDILKSWKQGSIQLVVNVGVLTEGFDYVPAFPNPNGLSALVIARPTLSPGLYLQMLGRGTRLKPRDARYQECLVIDVVGNANLLETRQITLPLVMPTHDEADEDPMEEFASTGHLVLNRPKKPQVLKINGPFERSWAAWGYNAETRCYYSGINGTSWAVLVPDATGSGLHHGYIYSQHFFLDAIHVEKYEKGCSTSWSREKITSRPGTLVEMMSHLNAIFAQNGAKSLVDKKARWRKEPPSEKMLNLLKWKDQSAYYDSANWNAGQVSLAIDWALLRPHIMEIERRNT